MKYFTVATVCAVCTLLFLSTGTEALPHPSVIPGAEQKTAELLAAECDSVSGSNVRTPVTSVPPNTPTGEKELKWFCELVSEKLEEHMRKSSKPSMPEVPPTAITA
ncbi:hypothetical protein IWQ62_003947 [Dispira parvispora]|uniref:Secreted protein n=1 Tax=Dispira parvispora TaxID=1520584 RepID=A0A9W8ANE6_9FUNG|nr:hypothetical protein IWQ62_003947 [Dispira parvispora]